MLSCCVDVIWKQCCTNRHYFCITAWSVMYYSLLISIYNAFNVFTVQHLHCCYWTDFSCALLLGLHCELVLVGYTYGVSDEAFFLKRTSVMTIINWRDVNNEKKSQQWLLKTHNSVSFANLPKLCLKLTKRLYVNGSEKACTGILRTWGGVGVEEGRPTGGVVLPLPAMISSVMSFPPWLGSRIRIWEDGKRKLRHY